MRGCGSTNGLGRRSPHEAVPHHLVPSSPHPLRNFHPSDLVLREQLPLTASPVQFSVIAVNVLYAVIGVVLMFLSYRTIDRLTPQVDFPAELQRGNVAVAIFVAAIFVSIALIIGKALG
jgi:putative membrane protein